MPYKGKGAGGWKGGKTFGAKKPWERDFGGRDGGRPALHRATCATCGASCEVPFKPNGRKPVLCSNCFKKDDYSEPREQRSYGRKESYGGRKESYSRAGNESPKNADIAALMTQMKSINEKLDIIIEALAE